MLKRLTLAAILMIIGLMLSGIAGAQSERLQIVASFSILADVVRNVAGDAADVTSLMPIGVDPHSFSPSPQDIVAVAEADVVFMNGINFEELLMEAIENAGGEPNLVVVSECINILPISEGHDHEDEAAPAATEDAEAAETTVELRADIDPAVAAQCEAHTAALVAMHEGRESAEHQEDDDHAEGEKHAHGEPLGALYTLECGHHEEEEAAGEETEGEEHGACDPHVWTDPHNVIFWTYAIRDTLVALDPANAQNYTANAAAYAADLDTYAHEIVGVMLRTVPEANRILVTNHETLGYLAANYGYEVVGVVLPGGSTGAEPSAADVATLIDLIKAEGALAVFAENTVSANIATQVAAESGAKFYTLLSDSLTDATGPGATYLDYIRHNAEVIAVALGGNRIQ
ncbi:MAG: zinc ABC transporter substrate-binding protein [Armatimonadetes bacterium]|nr:zinc ABC transporter substrate-binding protein [Anaerolineae bacterium]